MYDFVTHAFLFLGALLGIFIFVIAIVVATVFVGHEIYVLVDNARSKSLEDDG